MNCKLKIPDHFNDSNKIYAWACEYVVGESSSLIKEEIDRVKAQGWEDCNHRVHGLYLVCMDKDKYELLHEKVELNLDCAIDDSEYALRHFEHGLKHYKKVDYTNDDYFNHLIKDLSSEIILKCLDAVDNYIKKNKKEEIRPEWIFDPQSESVGPFKRRNSRKGDSSEKG